MPRDPEISPPPASEPARPEPVIPERVIPKPTVPEQSREDTDADWGEYRAPDDNERLYRDRPPHWDDY